MSDADDVQIHLIDLPPRIRGVACVDEEGTPTVYLNSKHSRDINVSAFAHELGHVQRDDFYNVLSISYAEGSYE